MRDNKCILDGLEREFTKLDSKWIQKVPETNLRDLGAHRIRNEDKKRESEMRYRNEVRNGNYDKSLGG